MKKILAVSGAIIVCILAVIGVLAAVKVETKFSYGAPTSIAFYEKSSVAKENGTGDSEFSSDSETYKTALKLIDKMLSTNMLTKVWNNDFAKNQISQDIDGKYSDYSNSVLSTNYAIKLNFSEKQKQVIEYNGDTKIIEYFSLLFILGEDNYHEMPVYFTIATSGNYQKFPITVKGNPKQLIKFIQNI